PGRGHEEDSDPPDLRAGREKDHGHPRQVLPSLMVRRNPANSATDRRGHSVFGISRQNCPNNDSSLRRKARRTLLARPSPLQSIAVRPPTVGPDTHPPFP